MTTLQKGLADSIDDTEIKAELRTVAKKLITHRIILAEILKECVEEFGKYDIFFIKQNCLVGEIRMDGGSAKQDEYSTIVKSDIKDEPAGEEPVSFSLELDAVVPTTKKWIRVSINIEIQIDKEFSCSVAGKAVYSLARMISSQKEMVFNHLEYENVDKVYSIWICPDLQCKNLNTVTEYGFERQRAFGPVKEPVENYDKMKAIIITLNDEGMQNMVDIIRFLSTLLSTTERIEKRKRILEEEFHIPMTQEIEVEMSKLCDLVATAERVREKKSFEMTTLQCIINLMDTMDFSPKKAMDALKISKEDQEKYAKRLAD